MFSIQTIALNWLTGPDSYRVQPLIQAFDSSFWVRSSYLDIAGNLD